MNRHVLLLLALLALLTPGLGGCIAFYTYKHVDMVVYDAETSQPLPGAKIWVFYGYEMGNWYPPPLNRPSEARRVAVTDQMGRAKLDVATLDHSLLVNADGYMGGQGSSTKYGRPDEPDKVYLYKGPEPQITIVVPNGYRGLLKIDVQAANARVQDEPGKRQFTFEASSTGYVRIDATPLLLEHCDWGDWGLYFIHFTDKNGTPIPHGDHVVPKRGYEAGPNEIALRTVGALGHRFLLVLGTESDRKKIPPYEYINGKAVGIDPKAFNAFFDQ